MTQLPATLVEAEALTFAREWIKNFASGTNPWSEDSPLTAEASRAMIQQLLRNAALGHPINRMSVVAAAKAGDEDADAALRTLLLEHKSRREAMPPDIEEFDMWLTLHGGGLRKRPARKKTSNVLRDICVAMTVAAVTDRFGLKPTGRSARYRSACSIVAEALHDARMERGRKTVEKIWERYGRAMPIIPGWTST
jgi:hypothetical protein